MDRASGIAVTFGTMGICSLGISVYRWRASGNVALSVDDATGGPEAYMSSLHDAVFDIARPDDFIDGYPLDEAAFWTRVCIFYFILCSPKLEILDSSAGAKSR
jgi:hypothetical protein